MHRVNSDWFSRPIRLETIPYDGMEQIQLYLGSCTGSCPFYRCGVYIPYVAVPKRTEPTLSRLGMVGKLSYKNTADYKSTPYLKAQDAGFEGTPIEVRRPA